METPPEPIDARQPADDLAETEFFACLDRALDSLPFEQKIAFVLSEIEGRVVYPEAFNQFS